MTTTIKQGFKDLQKNLEITDLQRETVSVRQTKIRKLLESELTVIDSFLSGSYARRTMIAPLAQADIDVFMVLNPDYYSEDGQASLLDKIKRILRKEYPKTPDISRNGQAVTITFSDFVVDVVPGFKCKGGGYLIPNTYRSEWISTDPKKHVDLSTSENAEHDGRLVPLIKMLKCWNRAINRPFRSFHIEVLAWDIFSRANVDDYAEAVVYFFQEGRELITKKNQDPAGYSGDVGYYLDTRDKIDSAVSRFETGYNRATKAADFASRNRIEDAVNEWRKVFGDYFPAYG